MEANESEAKQPEPCCDSSSQGSDVCCSSGSGGGKKWKTMVFIVVVLLAGAVAAHSLLTKKGQGPSVSQEGALSLETVSVPDTTGSSVESPAASEQPSKPAGVSCGVTLDSIKSLARIADEKKANAAFILLPGEDEGLARTASTQIEATVDMLSAKGKQVAAFTLQKGAEGHDRLVRMFSVETFPCVIVTGKGCGAGAVWGEITEAKLLSAFVKASTPVSCGPVGCCPSGGKGRKQ